MCLINLGLFVYLAYLRGFDLQFDCFCDLFRVFGFVALLVWCWLIWVWIFVGFCVCVCLFACFWLFIGYVCVVLVRVRLGFGRFDLIVGISTA